MGKVRDQRDEVTMKLQIFCRKLALIFHTIILNNIAFEYTRMQYI